MYNYIIKNFMKSLMIFSFIIIFLVSPAFSEETDNVTELIDEAEQHLLKGEYKKSLSMYDEILEIITTDSKIHELKGIALSNVRLQSTLGSQATENSSVMYDILNTNKLSALEFYKALEINPASVIALNGLGIGFGNFGEYDEAKKYFVRALEIEPDNFVTKNYLVHLEKTIKKYPTKSTEKPSYLLNLEKNEIPYWIKTNASWWASDKISDADFIAGIQYLVKNKIIRLDSESVEKNSSNIIPSWIKNNAKWWSTGKISDDEFLIGIKYLITNGMINVSTQKNSEMVKKELERTAWNFERYLEKIKRDIKNENRYIEYPNPSDSVIIKYWKEPHKWNLGQYLERPLDNFEPAKVYTDDDTYIVHYKIFVNEQPPSLPLDHVSALENSLKFWEEEGRVSVNGKNAIIKFELTNLRSDASAWVTWVVRDLGENVLGHATIGRGIVEVALGDYGCDGGFQLFTVDTVQTIMTHELGHSLGIQFGNPEDPAHSDNPDNIMYPTIEEVNYSYCLLS
jgi:tetratricopeptide (TPR) repeat protein